MALKNSKSSAAHLTPSKKVLELAAKMKASATDGEARQLRKEFLKHKVIFTYNSQL
jgi:hypothetical protein